MIDLRQGDCLELMEDTYDVIKNVPMVAEVEYSTTNWKEKKEWKDENTCGV